MEGNHWKDTFWGVQLSDYKGANVLGQILMKVRECFKLIDAYQVKPEIIDHSQIYIQDGSPLLGKRNPGQYEINILNENEIKLTSQLFIPIIVHRNVLLLELQAKQYVFYMDLYLEFGEIGTEVDTTIRSHK
jgi:hypothetical protein